MSMKPLVYIASPYTKGQLDLNVRFQMEMFYKLAKDGVCTPYAPLWSHFQHLAFPMVYQDWIEYTLAIAARCDMCLRLPSEGLGGYIQIESVGADGEEAFFREQGKPVFYSVSDLYAAISRMAGA